MKGVLLMAYGTPRNLDEVEPFYIDIRRGHTPSPELIENLKSRYRAVGGKTPLLEVTNAQAVALERELGAEYRVFQGMKHWHPYIEQAVGDMARAGIQQATAMALAPHYSAMSVGGYFQAIDEAQTKLGSSIRFNRVDSWHLQRSYLEAVAGHVRAAVIDFTPDVVVFTAHSLPKRILETGDPYVDQLQATSRALAAELDIPNWTFSFQSAGATGDAWLGPDILQTIDQQAGEGVRRMLVVPVGFISDHLEILYDLDVQATGRAQAAGIELRRIASLNDDPKLIRALAENVRQFS